MQKPHRSLDSALHTPTSDATRRDIIQFLWGDDARAYTYESGCDWDAYFTYYAQESRAALMNEGKHVSVRTHADVLRIAKDLHQGETLAEISTIIRRGLTQQRPSAEEDTMVDGSLRLASRLFAMINIGPLPTEVPSIHLLPWNHGSLSEAIGLYFDDPPEVEFDGGHITIGLELTCRNVNRVTGIEVVPTNNLIGHLRLSEGDKKLCVFHQISFLRGLSATGSSIFPRGLIDETLDTLKLLFPDNDRKARRWLEHDFQANPGMIRIDLTLLKCGHFKPGHPSRRLEHYHFWRDRLGALAEAVDDATPPTRALLKVLKDRKKGDRWLNSWVAMVAIGLTVFFGLVQSIEGAIQVYKAYH